MLLPQDLKKDFFSPAKKLKKEILYRRGDGRTGGNLAKRRVVWTKEYNFSYRNFLNISIKKPPPEALKAVL